MYLQPFESCGWPTNLLSTKYLSDDKPNICLGYNLWRIYQVSKHNQQNNYGSRFSYVAQQFTIQNRHPPASCSGKSASWFSCIKDLPTAFFNLVAYLVLRWDVFLSRVFFKWRATTVLEIHYIFTERSDELHAGYENYETSRVCPTSISLQTAHHANCPTQDW